MTVLSHPLINQRPQTTFSEKLIAERRANGLLRAALLSTADAKGDVTAEVLRRIARRALRLD